MKHQIIEIDEYLLVVDEGEIKGWYYDAYINKVKHSGGAEYGESIITRNIIAHLPLNGSPILKGVDLLPQLENEVDVEKKAHAAAGYPKHEGDREKFYIKGYTQALQDNKDKKYTEEDLREALSQAFMASQEGYQITSDEIIQSLSQPKMPIGFECEMEDTFTDGYTHDRVRRFYGKEPKTTTTPEGHTQWVGKYIYQ